MARKSRNSRLDLPPLELECMKALWTLGQATVEDIRGRLFPQRPLAYTTVMTVMDRLARKGAVEREKRGRAHLYRASVPEALIRERALGRLVENFFRGSRQELRRYLQTGGGAKPISRLPEAAPEGRRGGEHTASRAAFTVVFDENIDTTLL